MDLLLVQHLQNFIEGNVALPCLALPCLSGFRTLCCFLPSFSGSSRTHRPPAPHKIAISVAFNKIASNVFFGSLRPAICFMFLFSLPQICEYSCVISFVTLIASSIKIFFYPSSYSRSLVNNDSQMDIFTY